MVYGAGLADLGHQVTGVCDSETTAAALNAARPIVHEHGVPELLRRNLKRRRLRYTTDYADALRGAKFAYISIDTPVGDDDGSDLSSILDAARRIGDARSGDLTVCVTAQVPVGTTHEIGRLVAAGAGRGRVEAAYVPEFLRLGTAIETFRKADRFVVGADDPAVARRVAALYASLKRPTLLTGVRTAEMGKHAANTFLAASISFINEVADLSEAVGADASGVAAILKADRRIGPHAFLSPGLGFAGGTLGREIKALQAIGSRARIRTPMMDATLAVNLHRPEYVTARLQTALGGLDGRTIGMLGLTYKPGTSTLRRAISVEIMRRLVERGARIRAYDPLADLSGATGLPPFDRVGSPYEAAAAADAVLLLTEWAGIGDMNLKRLRAGMRGRLFFDTRNLLPVKDLERAGFEVLGIGRGGSAGGNA
jgi:UDPglucose 6-dehydrogenase